MKKILLILMMLVGIASSAQAQVDEVTLVVSGEGVTKDEATTKALRSAIEQSFGVFVSASTEILNDELVRDEIATVSSGNIKKYTELGAIQLQNGKTEVTLQATVSIKKLTQYAKSHGSSAEFAGAVFAQNMKLIELNRENTTKSFQSLNRQLALIEGVEISLEGRGYGDNIPKHIYRDFYSCDLSVGNPKADGTVDVTLTYYTTEKAVMVGTLIANTLAALAIPPQYAKELIQQGFKIYEYEIPTPNNIFNSKIDRQEGISFQRRKIYFYAPLLIPIIEGKQYSIYDNLGNEYNTKPAKLGGVVKRVGQYSNYHYYSWDEYDGLDIRECIQEDRYLCIPDIYLIGFKTNRKKVTTFEPQLVIECKRQIQIPLDIISKVSNFTAKQPEKIK